MPLPRRQGRDPIKSSVSSKRTILVGLVVILLVAVGFVLYDVNHKSTVSSPKPPNGAGSPSPSGTVPASSTCTFHEAIACDWYIGAPVLQLIDKANPSLAALYFDHPTTFVAVTEASQLQSIPAGWDVTPIFTYFDETLLHSAISNHTLPAGIRGVSLDDELAVCKVYGKSECTPQAEQKNPVPYEQDAAKLAKQAGLVYLDVGAAPDAQKGNNRWHAAAFASYVDSQIQLSEANLTRFTQESSTYLNGWRSGVRTYTTASYAGANTTSAKVIDGITAKVPTCPNGMTGCTTYTAATPAQMVDAVKATMSTGIWGYWLNCPSGSTPGPGPCGAQDVAAMVSFLTDMKTIY